MPNARVAETRSALTTLFHRSVLPAPLLHCHAASRKVATTFVVAMIPDSPAVFP